ncbi:MAG: hypothetical protein US40_C0004G0047 [Candidatus Roizmanbacteria bacterium GW2011_GWC2_37_13]|uniref:Uncharacterized protein n=1 Tax=Candidatus Roizmanbacteria bacterium GW2011_GWC2_37_13 TaxID=1618486 RepID=A0A0G0G7J2_9BACT|nr:MAG: hypothetical protein US38_C0001G0034 [Candidatus Roizmanbacteria bacterium GW2011_GWC1_37_12]KKQ26012.1 MAG: hypothetical protein US40_C0004G0047 [Candidatus Roizmanbacteria bacterium GW2011_GWC2_37_13]
MYSKKKVVARVQGIPDGKKVYCFQDKGEQKQVVIETGI